MTNIDLYQSIQDEKTSAQKKGIMDKGMMVVIFVLVFSFAVWGGLKFYNLMLDKKLANVSNEITIESGKIESSKMDKVADFQERMEIIKQNIPQKEDPVEFLGNLEKSVMPSVIIDSCEFKYGDNVQSSTLSITAIADSFKVLAEQVLSLKENSYFKNVEMGAVTRNQDGKIMFVINAGFESLAK